MATEGQKKFLSALLALSKEDRFCNIKIEFSDGDKKFNRLMLAALSPFFEVMLSSAMKEGLSGVVRLPTVSSEIFEAVLDYYINGVGDLDERTLHEFIDATEMMQMPDLKELCVRNMKEKLTPENCLRVWHSSRKYTSDKYLESRSFETVCENFEIIHTQVAFLHLPKEDILRLIRLRNISRAADVLEAVLLWIEANEPDETDAVEVFKEVRLNHVEPSCILEKVYREGILKYKEIENMMKTHVLQNVNSMSTTIQRTSEVVDVIIVCSTSANKFNVHAWDIKQKRWYDLSMKPQHEELTEFAAAFVDQKIVISGGRRQRVVSDTFFFNASDNVWTVGPQLVYARYRHGSVSIQNSVYVVGGCAAKYDEEKGLQNATYLTSIEEWSPYTNRWAVVGNLYKAVADAAVEKTGQLIIVFGGDDGSRDGTSEVQCFNTESMSCFVVCRINNRKYYRSDVFLQKAYLCSSYSAIQIFQLVESENTGILGVKEEEKKYFKDAYASNFAIVAIEDKLIMYAHNFTREVLLNRNMEVTLPTVPGDVKAVHCAFRARIARGSLIAH